MTALFYGDRASLKLRPQPQGWLERYSFVVSVDGEEDVRYDTPGFDSGEKPNGGGNNGPDEEHYIPLQFSTPPAQGAKGLMEPHTVRITSIASTPFSFEGLLVDKALLNQGRDWLLLQSRRPVMEFVGEGIDAERPGGFLRTEKYDPPRGESVEAPSDAIFSTVQWQVAEHLGVRHSHLATGVCLADNCSDSNAGVPGLASQYFYTSPLNVTAAPVVAGASAAADAARMSRHNPLHAENRATPWRFPELSTSPPVPVAPATHVIVDTGVYDVIYHQRDPAEYTRLLATFLRRIRSEAHPDAKILAVARSGLVPVSTLPPGSPEVRRARAALYVATQQAVLLASTNGEEGAKEVVDANMYFAPVILSPNEDAATSYLRTICPHILPPVGLLQSSKALAVFRDKRNWNLAESVCVRVEEAAYRRRSQGVFWGCVVMGMVVGALWVARATVIGALAAIFGRRRLGLPEEDHEVLAEAEEGGHGKLG